MKSDFILRRSEIASRVSLCEGSDLVSHEYLSSLLQVLDDCSGEGETLWVSLCEKLEVFVDDLSVVRSELSFVPMGFVYKKHVRYNPYASPQRIVSYGLEREGRRFAIGSQSCPRSVLPVAESELSDDMVVWCLYPVDLARRVSSRLVKVWSSSDSLVDNLVAWTASDRKSARCVRQVENDDVLWEFSVVPQPSSDTRPSSMVRSQEMRPKDRILAYLREHSPVSTSDILAQEFAGRSRVYEILKQLERDDKITKVRHGVYRVI